MVEVFRCPEASDTHVDELLALRPRYVGLQLGIRDDAGPGGWRKAGVGVVRDRCRFRDHSVPKAAGEL